MDEGVAAWAGKIGLRKRRIDLTIQSTSGWNVYNCNSGDGSNGETVRSSIFFNCSTDSIHLYSMISQYDHGSRYIWDSISPRRQKIHRDRTRTGVERGWDVTVVVISSLYISDENGSRSLRTRRSQNRPAVGWLAPRSPCNGEHAQSLLCCRWTLFWRTQAEKNIFPCIHAQILHSSVSVSQTVRLHVGHALF